MIIETQHVWDTAKAAYKEIYTFKLLILEKNGLKSMI